MLATTPRTLSSSPRPMEETPITTATPMTIPSTVSDERSLLPRRVSVAICTISPNSLFRIMRITSLHLESQGCEGARPATLPCGKNSKNPPPAGRHQQPRHYCPELDGRRHAD